MRFNPLQVILHKHWKTGKTKKRQNSSLVEGTFWLPSLISYHIVNHLGLQPLTKIIMSAIPIAFKIDFSQKPNTINFRSIFYLNMLSTIFSVIVERSFHQNYNLMTTLSYTIKYTPLSLLQVFNLNMLPAILDDSHYHKFSKLTTMVPPFKIETCNKSQAPLSFGQSST